MADAPPLKASRKSFFLDNVLARSLKKKLLHTDRNTNGEVAEVEWVAMELSNYGASLRRDDVDALFEGFPISPDFVFPAYVNFSRPFRTTIWIAGAHEAQRAVEELHGTTVKGRAISVKVVIEAAYEERENMAREVADNLKKAIISMSCPEIGRSNTDRM